MATPTEKDAFSNEIERRIGSQNINIIEAIMDVCEETGLEVEVAATLLNDSLKEKLEKQANGFNLLKKPKKPVKKTGKQPYGKGVKKS